MLDLNEVTLVDIAGGNGGYSGEGRFGNPISGLCCVGLYSLSNRRRLSIG